MYSKKQKPDKYWKFITIQHPMYLLVRFEESKPKILEQTEPWGYSEIKKYIKRIQRNLNSLDLFPELKLNFEFSGLELELLLIDAPKVVDRIKKYIQEKRIELIGGDYSQPHAHVFSSELAYQQLKHGYFILQYLFGVSPITYAHQESQFHAQVPQLLNIFNYKFASVSPFPYTIEFLSKSEELMHFHHFISSNFSQDQSLIWKGLDESTIPIYPAAKFPKNIESRITGVISLFKIPAFFGKILGKMANFIEKRITPYINTIMGDAVLEGPFKGSTKDPQLIVEFPDMIEISKFFYQNRIKHGKFFTYSEGLKEYFSKHLPEKEIRIGCNWSYCEGMWAEKLARTTKQAENFAVLCETFGAVLNLYDIDVNSRINHIFSDLYSYSSDSNESYDSNQTKNLWNSIGSLYSKISPFDNYIWKPILASQHHDIYWLETESLKYTALDWLNFSKKNSLSILEDLGNEFIIKFSSDQISLNKSHYIQFTNSEHLVVWNLYPKTRKSIVYFKIIGAEFENSIELPEIQIKDEENNEIKSQIYNISKEEDKYAILYGFSVKFDGLGYRSFSISIPENRSGNQNEKVGDLDCKINYKFDPILISHPCLTPEYFLMKNIPEIMNLNFLDSSDSPDSSDSLNPAKKVIFDKKMIDSSLQINMQDYKLTLTKDGIFSNIEVFGKQISKTESLVNEIWEDIDIQIVPNPELINKRYGNIKANDLLGLSPYGKILEFKSDSAIWWEGSDAICTFHEGNIGNIHVIRQHIFYRNIPKIDAIIYIEFDHSQIGLNSWIDFSKLNLYFPFNRISNISHDIPFGNKSERKNLTFFAPTWVKLGLESGINCTYVNYGTPRHICVKDTLVNILAWGGNQFSNRMAGFWENIKKFDRSIPGPQIVTYTLLFGKNNEFKNGKSLYNESNPELFAPIMNSPVLTFYSEKEVDDNKLKANLLNIKSPIVLTNFLLPIKDSTDANPIPPELWRSTISNKALIGRFFNPRDNTNEFKFESDIFSNYNIFELNNLSKNEIGSYEIFHIAFVKDEII